MRSNVGKTTKLGYELTALSVSGVATANAVNFTTNPPQIYLYITSTVGNGIPSTALVSSVQTEMDKDENKDPLDTITVVAPTGVSIACTYSLTIETGFTSVDVIAEVESALTTYINGLGAGQDVLKVHLDNVVHDVQGVANYTRTAPTTDTTIDADEKAITGTLTIS